MEPAPRTPLATTDARPTVLVVDDDPSVLGLVTVSLEEAGFQVLKCANAERAVQACRHHPGPIHLLIADIMLPPSQLSIGAKTKGVRLKTDGLEMVQKVKALRPGIRVMLMSGQSEEALKSLDAAREYTAGQHPLLRKPFSQSMMLRMVKATLGEGPAR